VEDIILKIKPVIVMGAAVCDFLGPYAAKGLEYANKLYQGADKCGAEELIQVRLLNLHRLRLAAAPHSLHVLASGRHQAKLLI